MVPFLYKRVIAQSACYNSRNNCQNTEMQYKICRKSGRNKMACTYWKRMKSFSTDGLISTCVCKWQIIAYIQIYARTTYTHTPKTTAHYINNNIQLLALSLSTHLHTSLKSLPYKIWDTIIHITATKLNQLQKPRFFLRMFKQLYACTILMFLFNWWL